MEVTITKSSISRKGKRLWCAIKSIFRKTNIENRNLVSSNASSVCTCSQEISISPPPTTLQDRGDDASRTGTTTDFLIYSTDDKNPCMHPWHVSNTNNSASDHQYPPAHGVRATNENDIASRRGCDYQFTNAFSFPIHSNVNAITRRPSKPIYAPDRARIPRRPRFDSSVGAEEAKAKIATERPIAMDEFTMRPCTSTNNIYFDSVTNEELERFLRHSKKQLVKNLKNYEEVMRSVDNSYVLGLMHQYGSYKNTENACPGLMHRSCRH